MIDWITTGTPVYKFTVTPAYCFLDEAMRTYNINSHVWRCPTDDEFVTGYVCKYCGAVSDEPSGDEPCKKDK
ncbi:hypothetical protein KAR91_07755 [Candidatus Pacearchaeota archaeon]|nr:hypothetical protein [Candidatus Pacearchaeota archaeon]